MATTIAVDLRAHVEELEQQRNAAHLRATTLELELAHARHALHEAHQLLVAQALAGVLVLATSRRRS